MNKSKKLKELFSCPLCLGFWTSILTLIFWYLIPYFIVVLSVANVGFVVHLLMDKFLPCEECTQKDVGNGFKVIK